MTIQHDADKMLFLRWITKARIHTHTHSEYIIIGFSRKQWLRKRFSMLRYTYTVCLVTT